MKKITLLLLLALLTSLHTEAHVNLLSPNGGESFNEGETVIIEWEVVIPHNSLNWDLYFSGDGGVTWTELETDIPLTTLKYNWIVPALQTNQTRIKIVQDNVDSDYDGTSNDFSIASSSTTGINSDLENFETNLYPNPLTDFSILEFTNPNHNNFTLTIYNTQGRIVETIRQISTSKVIIRRNNLASGLYFSQLHIERDVYSSGRLVIE